MPEARFSQPVVAYLPHAKGGPSTRALETPREGIIAVVTYGLGEFDVADPELYTLITLLKRAIEDPAPERLERARQALENLAAKHPGPVRPS